MPPSPKTLLPSSSSVLHPSAVGSSSWLQHPVRTETVLQLVDTSMWTMQTLLPSSVPSPSDSNILSPSSSLHTALPLLLTSSSSLSSFPLSLSPSPSSPPLTTTASSATSSVAISTSFITSHEPSRITAAHTLPTAAILPTSPVHGTSRQHQQMTTTTSNANTLSSEVSTMGLQFSTSLPATAANGGSKVSRTTTGLPVSRNSMSPFPSTDKTALQNSQPWVIPTAVVIPLVALIVFTVAGILCYRKRSCFSQRLKRNKRTDSNGSLKLDKLNINEGTNNKGFVNSDDLSVVGPSVYTVQCSYIAQEENELSLEVGERLKVILKYDSDWWVGHNVTNGKEGYVPASYLVLDAQHAEKGQSVVMEAQRSPEQANVTTSTKSRQSGSYEHLTNLDFRGSRYYKAVYSYQSSEDGDLCFLEGDIIEALEGDPEAWVKGYLDRTKMEGWLPGSYLEPVDTTQDDKTEYAKLYAQLRTCNSGATENTATFAIEHVALYDYEIQEEGDLSFKSGEIILVVETLDNGWWLGCIGADRHGWFPGNLVELVDDIPTEHAPSPYLSLIASSDSQSPGDNDYIEPISLDTNTSSVPVPVVTESVEPAVPRPLRPAPSVPSSISQQLKTSSPSTSSVPSGIVASDSCPTGNAGGDSRTNISLREVPVPPGVEKQTDSSSSHDETTSKNHGKCDITERSHSSGHDEQKSKRGQVPYWSDNHSKPEKLHQSETGHQSVAPSEDHVRTPPPSYPPPRLPPGAKSDKIPEHTVNADNADQPKRRWFNLRDAAGKLIQRLRSTSELDAPTSPGDSGGSPLESPASSSVVKEISGPELMETTFRVSNLVKRAPKRPTSPPKRRLNAHFVTVPSSSNVMKGVKRAPQRPPPPKRPALPLKSNIKPKRPSKPPSRIPPKRPSSPPSRAVPAPLVMHKQHNDNLVLKGLQNERKENQKHGQPLIKPRPPYKMTNPEKLIPTGDNDKLVAAPFGVALRHVSVGGKEDTSNKSPEGGVIAMATESDQDKLKFNQVLDNIHNKEKEIPRNSGVTVAEDFSNLKEHPLIGKVAIHTNSHTGKAKPPLNAKPVISPKPKTMPKPIPAGKTLNSSNTPEPKPRLATNPVTALPHPKPRVGVPRKVVLRKAIRSYHSADTEELSFEAGSFIKDIREVPGQYGWRYGMLADGTTGKYREECVELAVPLKSAMI